MQFFCFFVSNMRIRASVLLFSPISPLFLAVSLQIGNCACTTKTGVQKQDAGSESGSNVCALVQPFAQSSGMGSFQTFSLRQNCAIMTAICSRVALLCGSRRRPPGAGMPLISPRSHAQFMAVRA